MRKLTIIVLAVIMAITLPACSGRISDPVKAYERVSSELSKLSSYNYYTETFLTATDVYGTPAKSFFVYDSNVTNRDGVRTVLSDISEEIEDEYFIYQTYLSGSDIYIVYPEDYFRSEQQDYNMTYWFKDELFFGIINKEAIIKSAITDISEGYRLTMSLVPHISGAPMIELNQKVGEKLVFDTIDLTIEYTKEYIPLRSSLEMTYHFTTGTGDVAYSVLKKTLFSKIGGIDHIEKPF